MNASKLTLFLATAALLAFGALLVLQYRELSRLQAERRASQEQLSGYGSLLANRQMLSNAVWEAEAKKILSDVEFHELLRLRGEATLLRREKSGLLGTIEDPFAGEHVIKPTLGGDFDAGGREVSCHIVVPRSSWVSTGYADPDSALRSGLRALSTANPDEVLKTLTPEKRALWQEAEMKDKISGLVAPLMTNTTGVVVLSRRTFTSDLTSNNDSSSIRFYVYLEGCSAAAFITLQRVGSEWKFDGCPGIPGGHDELGTL